MKETLKKMRSIEIKSKFNIASSHKIFLHIAKKNYSGTQGCVALKKSDFLEILQFIKPNEKIKIIDNF